MLTPDEVTALQFAGVSPPVKGMRTTCPKCSHTRVKSDERCLVIKPRMWGLEVYCHHCDYRDGVVP